MISFVNLVATIFDDKDKTDVMPDLIEPQPFVQSADPSKRVIPPSEMPEVLDRVLSVVDKAAARAVDPLAGLGYGEYVSVSQPDVDSEEDLKHQGLAELPEQLRLQADAMSKFVARVLSGLSTRRKRIIATVFVFVVVIVVLKFVRAERVAEAKRKRKTSKRKRGDFYLNGFGAGDTDKVLDFKIGGRSKRINLGAAGGWAQLRKFYKAYGDTGELTWHLGDRTGSVEVPEDFEVDDHDGQNPYESKKVAPPIPHKVAEVKEAAALNNAVADPLIYKVVVSTPAEKISVYGTLIEGKVVTVNHVFADMKDVPLSSVVVTDMLGAEKKVVRLTRASALGLNADLAALEIVSPPRTRVSLCKIDPSVGMPVFVRRNGHTTAGKIVKVTAESVGYDIATTFGDCGLPFVSCENEASGIVSLHNLGGDNGVNYGVPAPVVREFLDKLNSFRPIVPSGSPVAAVSH